MITNVTEVERLQGNLAANRKAEILPSLIIMPNSPWLKQGPDLCKATCR